ncbi:hypothetical protein Trydic_g7294 [Trypoxylus dichotomus]
MIEGEGAYDEENDGEKEVRNWFYQFYGQLHSKLSNFRLIDRFCAPKSCFLKPRLCPYRLHCGIVLLHAADGIQNALLPKGFLEEASQTRSK